ncbi:MAG: hypothetical protein H7X79_06265 [Sporomusaceae bacterium]|nr:hypothetical protein [Sporomusaceae bacterium]
MALKPDFQNALQTFIFLNLPVLMNPANAMNLVVSTTIIPTLPTIPITPITPINPTVPIGTAVPTAPVLSTDQTLDTDADTEIVTVTAQPIFITPEALQALQAYVVNNFPDLGLPQDIQQVAKEFFANIPPVVPVVPPTAVVTPVALVVSDGSSLPNAT